MGRLNIPALSEAFVQRAAAVSRAELGLDHVQGKRLVEAVAQVSHTYTRERHELSQLQGDGSLLSARLQFYLPRDLLKVHGPLAELHSVGALPRERRWRVLDLGAGLGSTTLGVARFAALSRSADALEVTALDIDPEALELFQALADDLRTLPGVPIKLKTRVADLEALPLGHDHGLGGPFDLIVLGLALNELASGLPEAARQARLLQRLLDLSKSLTPSGSLVILEPALRETSRVLHGLRDQLVARGQSPFVFAPCLHASECPMLARERDFCHERLPCELPEAWAQLASSAGLRERDLTYSYLTLTAGQRSLAELDSGGLYRAVSGQLKSKGKTEVWLCGMGSAPRAQRLDRHGTESNADIEAAERGCVIEVANAPAPTASGLMRIEKSTEVRLLQRWVREP